MATTALSGAPVARLGTAAARLGEEQTVCTHGYGRGIRTACHALQAAGPRLLPAGTAAGAPVGHGRSKAARRLRRASAPPRADAGRSEPEAEVPAGSVSVILLAGGVGKRMGASMPKQYLPLEGRPIALYSLLTFAGLDEVGEVVIVCDASWRHIFADVADDLAVRTKYAAPGAERQDSVYSGLQEVRGEAALVAVHDSARPLVTAEDTRKVIRDARKHGAAVLGVPVKATIKQCARDGFVVRTLDRSTLWEMQTPQVIEPGLLRRGFEHVRKEALEVTDDVSIVEHLLHPVFVTHGSYTNLKVTTPDDLLVAERILHQRQGREMHVDVKPTDEFATVT